MTAPAPIIAVESGVPMPPTRLAPGALKRAAMALAVGESFLLPAERRNAHHQVASTLNRRYAPLRFTCRKTPDGYRLWRVA
jgi:hypothetical protein